MKKLFILFVLLFALSMNSCSNGFLRIDKLKSYERTTYYLDLALNPVDRTLAVEGKIVYVNDTKDFDELKLMLYVNAEFEEAPGNIVNFEYLKVDGNVYDVIYSGSDDTTISLDLIDTIELGENILIEFKYEYEYWDFGRNYGGYLGFYSMFFYPFVAKYDESGWNNDAYTFKGESYYNDIGDYYVSLSVPEEYLVASSGEVIEEIVEEGTKTLDIVLLHGRDFSFSASPTYHHYEKLVDGRTYHIYSRRELTVTEELNVFEYIEDSFTLYEDIIGPYDYNHYTIELGNIYGMESTGIAYCSDDISEGTIVHEIIHQWFYSMIGNDQSDFSFIDEALTTYATGYYFGEVYGNLSETEYYYYRSSFRPDLDSHWQNTIGQTMLRKVDEYENEYGYIIYYHGPTLYKYYVDTFLEGDKTLFIEFMRSLYDTYKYEIVTLDELLDLLEQTTQVEITKEWFVLMLNEIQNPENRPV